MYNLKCFEIQEITDQKLISEILQFRNSNIEIEKTETFHIASHSDIAKVDKLLSLSGKLSYPEFEEASSILFEIAKDESKIEIAFEKCQILLSKYDFSNGVALLPIYYFEKSDVINKQTFKDFYLNYLKRIPLNNLGKWNVFWKPQFLDSNQQLELVKAKYDEIKSLPFDFQNELIFEFSLKLLSLWALNDRIDSFYPFLVKISDLPDECKIKKNDWLYTIDPNSKYAAYQIIVLKTLNYYTYKNPKVGNNESELIMGLINHMDTYYHPVNTEFIASIIINLYPEKSYKDFEYIFKHVKEPVVAQKCWENKVYSYQNIIKWFSSTGIIPIDEVFRKKIETQTIENLLFFLNKKSNVLNILELSGNIIGYDSEVGFTPIGYNEFFRDNYQNKLPLENNAELIQIPAYQNKLHLIFKGKYYQFEISDFGDYVDSMTLSYICNYLLEIEGSKMRVIPIVSEDQSTINLFLDLEAANKVIDKFQLKY